MVKKMMFGLLLFIVTLNLGYSTDMFVEYNFNYEFGTNSQNVEVLVFKCQDSTCRTGRVTQIPTQIFQKQAANQCFRDLSQSQMNNCMSNYAISGNKAPSNGMVIKLTDVQPSQAQNYLVALSVRGDTFVTVHDRVFFTTQFPDYDYSNSPLSITFTKVQRPKANIQSFYVENMNNRDLPIQVNVRAGMSSTVCSAFAYATNYHKPQFSNGYSDYAAKTDISLQVIDRVTGNVVASDTKTMNIEASTCSGFHTFEWTPPSNFENREVEFRVTTDIVDDQAHLPRRDQDSKIVTIYPENLTDACWVVGNNLVVANRDTTNPQVGDFVITIGEDAFLSFEALAYKSRNQDGSNLQFIDYRVRIRVDGIQIVNEVVTSNSGLYKKNIKEQLRQFTPGEVEVVVLLDPIGEGCSRSERTTLTTRVDLINPPITNNPPVLSTPSSLNGGTNQQVQGPISANDIEDGDLTNQIICTSTSSSINVNANQGTLRV
ncbi:MAG: hypothetical protein LAT82_04930, partial [Nanoarchaeota archaeon]|nr:hypothetical protein [Nanoarchaeota archaeon]